MYTNANGDRNTRSPVANDSCYSYPFDAIEQTLFELANADRLRILFKLHKDKQSNLSKIARDLNLIVQEVHRNINRLIEAGFVHKQSANNYSLTTFGRSLLLHLSSLKFLSENNAYFSDHTFGELPLKFVQRIGALDNSRLLESSVAVFEYPRELFDSSHSYVYAIMSEVPLHFIEYAWRALMRGVKMNYLVSHNAVVPRKRHSESEHSKFIELLKMSQLQRRMVEQVQVSLIMNETRAIVAFPNLKGRTDFNFAFYNMEPVFHDWCHDYFNYRWQNSKPYDSKKLFEVRLC